MNAIAEAFVNIRPDTSGFRRALTGALDREITAASRIKPIRIPVLGVAAGDAAASGLTQLIGLVGQLGGAAVAIGSQVGSATVGILSMGAAAARTASLVAVLPTALASAGLVLGTVKLASKGLKEALEAVAEGADDAGEKIAKLAPPARAFAVEVQRLMPRVEALQKRLAAGLFPGVTEGFKALLPLFPDVSRSMERTSVVLGDLAAAVGRLVGGPLGNEIRTILRIAADLVGILASNVTGLVTAFVTASAAAAPLARLIAFDLSESVRDLTDRFTELARTDEFTDFLEDSYRNLTIISQSAANVGVGLGQAFLAALDPGERLLRLIRALTFDFRQFASSAEGQDRMEAFFERGAASAELLGSVVGNVLASIGNIGKAAGPAGTALVTSLDGATEAFRRFTGSVEGQQKMTTFFNDIVPVTQEFGRLIVDITKALGTFAALPGNEELLRQIRTELLPAVTKLFVVIAQTGVLNNFITFLTKATDTLIKLSENGRTLNGVLDVFNGALDILNKLLELPGVGNLLTFTTYLVGATAALRLLGGLALGVGANLGFLVSALSSLRTVASVLGPVLHTALVGGLLRLAPLIAPALAVVFSPPVLIAAAVAAVGVLVYTFREEIGRFFTETLPTFFTETIPTTFNTLRALFDENAPKVLLFFQELPPKIAEAMGELAGTLIAKGVDLLTGLDNGILRIWQGDDGGGGIKGWFVGLGPRIVDTVGDQKDTLKIRGQELIAGFFNGAGLEWNERKSFWDNLGPSIVLLITNPGIILLDTGKKVMAGLFKGALEELKAVANLALLVDESRTALTNEFKDAGLWLLEIGRNVAAGFFKGLKEGLDGKGTEAIKDFANAVTFRLGGALKIGSPSKRMIPLGAFTAEGFLVGLMSQQAAIEQQIDKMAAAVVSGLSAVNPVFGATPTYNMGAKTAATATSGAQQTVIKHYNLTLQSSYESEATPEENFRRMELLEPLGV